MNRSIILVLLLICSSYLTKLSAQQKLSTDSLYILADSYMSQLTALKKFNGTILLKRKDRVVLKKAYNLSQDSSNTLFVTTKSQFDLRSVSKLFAKASILQLERMGKIDVNTAIIAYIPGFPNGDKITVNHLLEHSSGLPREFSTMPKPFLEMTPEEVLALAKKEPLEFEPGLKSQYSNVGFQLVYYLIGKLSENGYAATMRKFFFSPLGMRSSGNNFDDPIDNKEYYAYGHYLSDKDEIKCECEFPDEDMRMGNLYSTIDDLDLFLSSLNSEDYSELVYNGKISHAGGTQGKRAYVELDIKEGYEIIFLTNYDAIPFEKIVTDLRAILMNEDVEIPAEINRHSSKVDPVILATYQGTYDLEEAGHIKLSIKLENEQLYVYQNGQNNGILYSENETTFFPDPKSEESVIFERDKEGQIYILVDFQGVRWKGIRISD